MNPSIGQVVLYQTEPLPAGRPAHLVDRGTDRAAIVTAVYQHGGRTVADLAVFEAGMPPSSLSAIAQGTTPGTFRFAA